jgi:hypothetical protein
LPLEFSELPITSPPLIEAEMLAQKERRANIKKEKKKKKKKKLSIQWDYLNYNNNKERPTKYRMDPPKIHHQFLYPPKIQQEF